MNFTIVYKSKSTSYINLLRSYVFFLPFIFIKKKVLTSVTTRGYFPSVSSVSVNPYPRIFGYPPDNPKNPQISDG